MMAADLPDAPVESIATDVLVIGSEGAGARAAIEAARAGARVLLLTKGRLGVGGVTGQAAYSCCAALGHADQADSPWEHLVDTLVGGDFLSDQRIARTFAEQAPKRMLELAGMGAEFDRRPDGRFDQTLMPGHRYARALHYQFATGSQFVRGLAAGLASEPRVAVRERVFALELLHDGDAIAGVVGIDMDTGRPRVVSAPSVVLATGGILAAYAPHAFAAHDLTGDGLAMALRAGVELLDPEFVQFFPTGLVWPIELAGMIWVGELRYHCGGWLLDRFGERFMARHDPARMELSTRDRISRAIGLEIAAGRGSPHGGVWLSVAHQPANLIEAFVESTFPGWRFGGVDLLAAGIDIRRDALEVAPVAHFLMGGVRVGSDTATSLRGLFAAGEVAGGLHGANRIEGNALPETQVFGALAGERAAEHAATAGGRTIDDAMVRAALDRFTAPLSAGSDGRDAGVVRAELQAVMWRDVGVVRHRAGLQAAADALETLARDIEDARIPSGLDGVDGLVAVAETRDLVLAARAMVAAALARTESRGAHFRRDHPAEDPGWLRHSVVSFADGQVAVAHEPVRLTELRPDDPAALDASGVVLDQRR